MLSPSHKPMGPTNTHTHTHTYKQRPYVGEHEVLPSGTFVEPLSFKLPSHQSLHLCKTFSSLNVSMKSIHVNYL